MNLAKRDEVDLGAVRLSTPLHKWLGKYHPLPYAVSDKAVIYVTHADDRDLVGKVVPVSIEYGMREIRAVVDERRFHSRLSQPSVEGIVYDPLGDTITGGWVPRTMTHGVVAPFEDGWVYGHLDPSSTPESLHIKVKGGVGVASPSVNGVPETGWRVTVSHAFRVGNLNAIPQLTDSYGVVRAKTNLRNQQAKEHTVQTVLMREALERDYLSDIERDDFPNFKYLNTYHVALDARVAVFALNTDLSAKNIEDKLKKQLSGSHLESFKESVASSRTEIAAREALVFSSEAVIVSTINARHPEEAEEAARASVVRKVRDVYGPTASIIGVPTFDVYFAGTYQ